MGKNTKDAMENNLYSDNRHFNTDNLIKSNSTDKLIQTLRYSIKSGTYWPQALIQAMGSWSLPNETYKGREYVYLIHGECFNMLLLAERLMAELQDLISFTDIENLLFNSEFPEDFDLSTLKSELGVTKYRGHVNFFYGVIVEENLQYIVEQEIEKRYYSNGIGDINNPSNKTFQKLYKATFDNLYIKFCIDTSVTKTKMFYFNDYIKFTYWLFKYRINISDGAKIASDTKKALKHITIKPQSCFAPVLFQLG